MNVDEKIEEILEKYLFADGNYANAFKDCWNFEGVISFKIIEELSNLIQRERGEAVRGFVEEIAKEGIEVHAEIPRLSAQLQLRLYFHNGMEELRKQAKQYLQTKGDKDND